MIVMKGYPWKTSVTLTKKIPMAKHTTRQTPVRQLAGKSIVT